MIYDYLINLFNTYFGVWLLVDAYFFISGIPRRLCGILGSDETYSQINERNIFIVTLQTYSKYCRVLLIV